jgi:hypothetical protein
MVDTVSVSREGNVTLLRVDAANARRGASCQSVGADR